MVSHKEARGAVGLRSRGAKATGGRTFEEMTVGTEAENLAHRRVLWGSVLHSEGALSRRTCEHLSEMRVEVVL